MRKLYSLFLIVFFYTAASAQHVNYNSSKWFWGFNYGGTWHSTDIDFERYNGWGLTLGRSYNYDYGHRLSFDIRGRFLSGQWYGQDQQIATLTEYVNPVLTSYLIGNNTYVHNFRSDVRELDLELVLHAGNLRDRTGFDPYIFGGLGLTWQQTWTDAFDTLGIYDYNSLDPSQNMNTQLIGVLDGIYETRLDGLQNNDWKVNWMPSLGFGLAFHQGRVSLGIEHKTTFTMGDQFDGLAPVAVYDYNPRIKNDWYHYTSGFIQFHIKGNEHSNTKPIRENNNVSNINNFTQNCPGPIISVVGQPQASVVVSSLTLRYDIANVNNAQEIQLTNAQEQSLPFNFNSQTGRLEALVTLTPGINYFILKAQTACGSKTQVIQIEQVNCQLPSVNILQASSSTTTVQQSNFVLTATLSGNLNQNQIEILHNNMSVNGASFNPNNGLLQRTLNLAPGNNIIRVSATNACGTAFDQINVFFDDCQTPQLSWIQPNAPGSTINQANYTIQAKISGSHNGGQVIIKHNNNPINYTKTGTTISANLQLTTGMNTFQISYSNPCGADQINSSINYQNCTAPIINITSPTINTTLNNAALRLRATIANVTDRNNIKVIVNGLEQSGFIFNANNGQLELNSQLLNGTNTITVIATNDCGSDVESFTYFFEDCQTPIINLQTNLNNTSSNSPFVVTNSYLNITATLLNMPSQNGISVTHNGQSIGFLYSANGLLNSSINLQPGLNQIVLTASRTCGQASKTIFVQYENCQSPQITLLQPTASGISTNVQSFNFKAGVTHITSSQSIQLKLNGSIIPFSYSSNQITSNINLNQGANTITLTAANACGNDIQTIVINFVQCQAPQITTTTNIPNGASTSNPAIVYNANLTNTFANQIQFKLNGQNEQFTFSNNQLSASLNLQPGANIISLIANNDCGSDIENWNIIYAPCTSPQIGNTSPSAGLQSSEQSIVLSAQIAGIDNANQIGLLQNGNAIGFDFQNGILQANVTLVNGNNNITLSTSNNCGSAQKAWNVTYMPCTAPQFILTNSNLNGSTVYSSALSITAQINGLSSNQVSLSLNGQIGQPFTIQNQSLSASLNLKPGPNTIVFQGQNSCDRANLTLIINYVPCQAPLIQFAQAAGASSNPTLQFSATVSGITNNQNVNLLVNNQVYPFNYNNGAISALINLQNGQNTVTIAAQNDCGTSNESIQYSYTAPCVQPTIEITSPAAGLFGQSSPSIILTATVHQISTISGIQVLNNGLAILGGSLNNNQLSVPMQLQPGINNITVTATNTCGTDSQQREIRYEPCSPPQVIQQMEFPNNSITNQSIFTYNVQIVNYTANMSVTFSMNGEQLNGFSNYLGNILAEVSLLPGLNSLVLTVTNDCGTTTDTYLITYDGSGGEGMITNPNGNKQEGKQDNLSVPNKTNSPAPSKPVAPKPTTPAPSKPAAPKPTSPAPSKPAAPKPTTPAPSKPAAPKPTTPAPSKPAAPKPTTPAPSKPAAPKPTTPAPSKPAAPKPTTPAPSKPAAPKTTTPAPKNKASEPASKPPSTNEKNTTKGGGR